MWIQVEWHVAKTAKKLGVPLRERQTLVRVVGVPSWENIRRAYQIPIWAFLVLADTPEYLSLSGTQLKRLKTTISKMVFNDKQKIVIVTEHILEHGPFKGTCLEYLEQCRE